MRFTNLRAMTQKMGLTLWSSRQTWGFCLLLTLIAAMLIASTLGIHFLNSDNLPTGGDTASHILYAKLYSDEFLWSGQFLPWMPEVFAGFPFLSYYFPLPFIVISLLAKPIGFAAGFKWGAFLACMLLPGAVLAASKVWMRFAWPASCAAMMAVLAFVLHEQNSIWGGNLLSTLAGEFAYSYSLFFGVLAAMAWSRATWTGRGWLLPSLLEAATGFSHGFPLLIVGFSTVFLLLDAGPQRRQRIFLILLKGHALAFCLLGGWLWPLLEMHGLTVPNDAAFSTASWRDFLPPSLVPVLACGVLGLVALAVPAARPGWTARQAHGTRFMVYCAGLAAVAFVVGNSLGLADIRFFPMVWLFGGVACAWVFGQWLDKLQGPWVSGLMTAALCLAMLGWLGGQVKVAPDWGLWNHSGLESKPQWQVLSKLFPAMRGELWSPRLVFEHDPANTDLGSTRVLEALPLFLDQRPVLEGLYMESAVVGPAVYQLQSEVSASPSSPLVRFPSAALDPQFAARHMNALHADSLLLRSSKAKTAIEASGLFDLVQSAPPFALYRLRNFDSELVQVLDRPLQWQPSADWMQHSFTWFKSRKHLDAVQPVYGETVQLTDKVRMGAHSVQNKHLSRNEIGFDTDAIGRPHLIKMSFHPRWRLETQGALRIAAPGYMLVIPEETQVKLVYGHTPIGYLGIVASVLSALGVVWLVRLGYRSATAVVYADMPSTGWWPLRKVALAWMALLALCGTVAWQSPERVYDRAWAALRAQQIDDAIQDFESAYAGRKVPAKREEALFWWAKSLEQAGQAEQARARYVQLVEQYSGYWVPESLHQLVVLERQGGNAVGAELFATRLRTEYPNSRWTLRVEKSEVK
ncbi:MAG: tetratricopeptide repeat protein [Rhodoferax sp.]|nr:tetratricopeptide repeat protein [Rhodoferax sp.]